jgi:hypothetical protein
MCLKSSHLNQKNRRTKNYFTVVNKIIHNCNVAPRLQQKIWSWIMGSSTMVLRQSQLSTSGDPEGLTTLSSVGLFSIPNKSFPISSTLLSTCILWDIASKTCFWASFFRGEPSGALRNCQWTTKIFNIWLLDFALLHRTGQLYLYINFLIEIHKYEKY